MYQGVRSLPSGQGFTLTARNNQPPVLRSTTPPITATPGKLYAYDIQATDPDGGKLVYTLDQVSLSKGMTLDELGRLRWTPTTTQVGAHAVTLTITDGAGASITQPIALTVAADTQAPLVKLKVGGLVPPNLGDSLTFAVSASDDVGCNPSS